MLEWFCDVYRNSLCSVRGCIYLKYRTWNLKFSMQTHLTANALIHVLPRQSGARCVCKLTCSS